MRKKKTSMFFKTFAGSFLNIYTSLQTAQSVESEEGTAHSDTPLVFQGYLLDKDDEYYYLGSTPDEVNCSIRIDEVKFAVVANEETNEDVPSRKDLN